MARSTHDAALVTADEFKTYWTGLTSGSAAKDDTRIAALIPRICGLVNEETGRVFGADDRTYYLDGDGSPTLKVPDWPINTVTSLNEDTGHQYPASSLLTQHTESVDGDYLVLGLEEEEGMILKRAGVWACGYRTVKLLANTGYGTIPEPLKDLVLQAVAYHYDRALKNMHARTTTSIGPGGQNIETIQHVYLPRHVREGLTPWRRAAGTFA